MIDVLIAFVKQDLANGLLLLAAATFLFFFLLGIFVPVFGGPSATDAETPGIAARVGAMVSSVFLILYGLVWILRGCLWVVRALLCPC